MPEAFLIRDRSCCVHDEEIILANKVLFIKGKKI